MRTLAKYTVWTLLILNPWRPSLAQEAATEAAADHAEMARMYEADQSDRRTQPIDWQAVSRRDHERQTRTKELLEEGALSTANDFFHAAMIFQHGGAAEDAKLAHELAKRAMELAPDLRAAAWLSAAAWDRYLMRQNKPQWYGTQYVKDQETGRWVLYEIDEDAVTDADRERLGVPTLAESKARVIEMNQRTKNP